MDTATVEVAAVKQQNKNRRPPETHLSIFSGAPPDSSLVALFSLLRHDHDIEEGRPFTRKHRKSRQWSIASHKRIIVTRLRTILTIKLIIETRAVQRRHVLFWSRPLHFCQSVREQRYSATRALSYELSTYELTTDTQSCTETHFPSVSPR